MKKIVLVAKGASGKDYLKEKLIKIGFKPSVSYTTRPPRPGEVEGKSYYFVSEETFQSMIDNDEFLEFNRFGDKRWGYGTSREDFMECTLFIMTPSGISKLSRVERKMCLVVYLNISEEVRRDRLAKRADPSDPVDRRIASDEDTFRGYDDFDVEVTEPLFDDEYIKNKIVAEAIK